MRLCLALGESHVDRLLATHTSAEVAEWLAFGEVEPYGGRQADLRAARVVEAVCAAAGVRVAPGEVFVSLGAQPRVAVKRDADYMRKACAAVWRYTGAGPVRRGRNG
jgi:hypothetical protein